MWMRFVFFAMVSSILSGASAQAQPDSAVAAEKAQAIFKKTCSTAGCHGAQSTIKFNANVRDSILAAKVVIPRDPSKSKLLSLVEDGTMPMIGDKLTKEEVKTLRTWIEAGAPDWNAPKPGGGALQGRKLVTDKELLQSIVRDLESADERQRPFLRYYSIANLNNNPEIEDGLLALYRTSLSKLVNSLSWNVDILVPKTLGPSSTLLRIDLRDYDWTPAIWQRIIAAYPYGLRGRNLGGTVDQIRALSHVDVPYVRADWFVANASVPPLYQDILQLPDNVAELERKLNVEAAADIAQEKCARAALRNSGISRSNRVVERHRSAYGGYWKSFDFADNKGPKNIFLNPLNFREDGGEFIFNLPNGLQAYFVANSAGKRLNEAPIAIVRDRTNGGDNPVVRNGRSCIGCHTNGMNTFRDEVRPILETQQKADFDLDHALALYVKQQDLDQLFDQDNTRFGRALAVTGSPLPKNPTEEPVNLLGLRYEADVSTAQAAADAGMEIKEFQRLVARSSELERLGFGTLQGANGGIKRDIWEEYFGNLVEELRLGDYLKPTDLHKPLEPESDRRITASLAAFRGDDSSLALRAQKQLFALFNQSTEVRIVSDRAEHRLQGSVTRRGETITVTVRDIAHNAQEEAQGTEKELDSLVQQVANRLHLRLTGTGLTARTGTIADSREPAPAGSFAAAVDPVAQLPLTLGGAGIVHIALSVDRGPGSTYKGGEQVVVRFKADRDCFLQIKNIDAGGNVVNLFPNEHTPSGRVAAGQIYALTDAHGKNIISVDRDGVFGQETIIAFATLEEDDLPAPRSKTLKVEGQGARQFATDVSSKARRDRVASVLVRFFTVK